MALELQAAEKAGIDTLWAAWETATDTELEATFGSIDYTSFLNVIKHLRSLGLVEDPQVPKLNIMVPGGLRFTLVGEGVIQAYCRDNSIKGKPFIVVLKERKSAGAGKISELDLKDYGVRIKIRRELPLLKDDPRVMEAVAKWATLQKSFRYMKRFSFTSLHNKGIQFDASIVRENKKDARGNYIQSTTFLGANITKQPNHYEMEVEVLNGVSATQKALMFGIVSVLRGIQKNHILIRKSVKEQVLDLLSVQTGAQRGKFPGSQPKTLRKAHMGIEPEANEPNIRITDYNVTDKADGLRCLLIVAKNGRIYMVNRNRDVFATDRRLDAEAAAEWGGAVLDGEWVTRDADNNPMSRYYAFDIFNGRKGEDVTQRPFIIRSEGDVVSRMAAMSDATTALNVAKYTTVLPKQHSFSIHMKTFHTPADPTDTNGIFIQAAAVLDRVKRSAPYHTDGLIFTPNASPLPKNVGTWDQQFKWKPASMNSVDFLVATEKEKGADGKPGAELISTKLHEQEGQIVRLKTLRLFVGSATDPAFVDPRDTVLNKKPYPASLHQGRGEYRAVEFSPQPPDPMASVCYVAINAGATDAASATTAAQRGESLTDNIYCFESGDPIEDRTVVEMVYDPKEQPGWRWKPLRVRWDKTERYSRGVKGGSMNDEGVANDVWLSIHDPITEDMIRTGASVEEEVVEGHTVSNTAYYQRRASQRDLHKIRGLREFHNRYIKIALLLNTVLTKGTSLIDMSVGQAGDIHKWIRAKVNWVLGCDFALTGLTDKKDGAYARYLNEIVKSKGSVPRMIFVQADSSVRLRDGSAGQTPLDRSILRTLWGESEPSAPPLANDLRGLAAEGFDVAALMFTLHFFFKDAATLDGLLRNISETVRENGYFVGCCFDGDRVAELLRTTATGSTVRGSEDGVDIWTITKKYEGDLTTDETGLGKAIDVGFISIGEAYTEYLVSFPYFVNRMASVGMELLNEEELAALGLKHSTNLFSESYAMAAADGNKFPMSPTVKKYSFLNRWFIFRRRSMGTMTKGPTVSSVVVPEGNVVAEAPIATTATTATASTDAVLDYDTEAVAEDVVVEETADGAAEDLAAEVPVPVVEAVVPAEFRVTSGPIYQFYHKSVAKDELKVGDKNWRRYISTYAPFPFKDRTNPKIIYPSLEAALGAAKYQQATDKPELGAQLFSIESNIHQSFEKERATMDAATLVEKEGAEMRDAQKLTTIRKKAKFNQDAWDAVKVRILADYVRQRYEEDAKFRQILDATAAQKARLVYYTVGGTNELSGSVKDDKIEGDNLLGRAYMKQVGLRY